VRSTKKKKTKKKKKEETITSDNEVLRVATKNARFKNASRVMFARYRVRQIARKSHQLVPKRNLSILVPVNSNFTEILCGNINLGP